MFSKSIWTMLTGAASSYSKAMKDGLSHETAMSYAEKENQGTLKAAFEWEAAHHRTPETGHVKQRTLEKGNTEYYLTLSARADIVSFAQQFRTHSL